MPCDLDVRDADFAIVEEGRRRQRAGGTQLTDGQLATWLADGRARGARLTLSLDGLMFVDDRSTVPAIVAAPCCLPGDPQTAFSDFTAAVHARLVAGAEAYRDTPAAERPLADLAGEIMAEVEDIAGWAACLWPRLRELRARLSLADTAGFAGLAGPSGS
ncbi:MAG: hypothetical protein ABI488_10010 [Polyangiaceae bacterium]